MEHTLDDIEAALERLEAQGARELEAPACDCVRRMLQRAEQLDPGSRRRLLVRVQAHFERLSARHERARHRAGPDVERLDARASEAPHAARRRSALRYEDAAAALEASFALAHSAQAVPSGAGPYNSHSIAHRALDAMAKLSPVYLRTQLNRLDELAELMQLPPAPDAGAVAPPRPQAGRRRPRGGRRS